MTKRRDLWTVRDLSGPQLAALEVVGNLGHSAEVGFRTSLADGTVHRSSALVLLNNGFIQWAGVTKLELTVRGSNEWCSLEETYKEEDSC